MLEATGIAPPKICQDMVCAAVMLGGKGGIAIPLAAILKPGWDLAQEFVNMQMGYGVELFEPGPANAFVNSADIWVFRCART